MITEIFSKEIQKIVNNIIAEKNKQINKALDDGHEDSAVFKMCKKQIERRGKMGLFYGYR